MKREWKPGDVATATIYGHDHMVFHAINGWVNAHSSRVGDLAPFDNIRPLVVIDPEDREQVERLTDLYWATVNDEAIADLQAALREFANPTPPKPEEPTDPTARVSDRRDNIWRLLADGDWVCTSGPDIGEYLVWAQLTDRGPLSVEATA